MRTIATLSLLLLLLAGCGAKNTDTAGAPSARSEAPTGVVKPAPVGTVVLKDGSTIQITDLKKFNGIYLHVSGQLNGRSSTLIRMTRIGDIQAWKGITFSSPSDFTIVSRKKKEFRFTNSHIYFGVESENDFIFLATPLNGSEPQEITVPKDDIKLISFNEPEE